MIPPITNLRARLSACRGVLIDSNVLLDIATNDPNWSDWSSRSLAECAEHTTLIINPIIYAEVSISYTTIEALDAALPITLYQREPLPWEAGFLAGKCYLLYRRRGGLRNSPLPDFYIGAHAVIGHLALLTRDVARYIWAISLVKDSTGIAAKTVSRKCRRFRSCSTVWARCRPCSSSITVIEESTISVSPCPCWSVASKLLTGLASRSATISTLQSRTNPMMAGSAVRGAH